MTDQFADINFIHLGNCVCDKPIYIVFVKIADASDQDSQACIVAHNEPMCTKFLELDPLEFLRYVRLSRGIGES